MITHYIPAFTEENGRHQRAACGAWVLPSQHATIPDCASCNEYLQQEAEGEAETLEALGLTKVDGFIVRKEATQ